MALKQRFISILLDGVMAFISPVSFTNFVYAADDFGDRITAGETAFEGYVHDPMSNPKAAKDIIVDGNAVYGYSPNPELTRLGEYAKYEKSSEPRSVERPKAMLA